MANRTEVPTVCTQCGTTIEPKAGGGRPRLYCSNKCKCAARYKPTGRPNAAEDCQQCGRDLAPDRHWRTLYCSNYCAQKANRKRNFDAIAAGKKRYYRENPDKHAVWAERRKPKKNEYMRSYYWANRDAKLEYQRSTRPHARIRERLKYAKDPSAKKAAAAKWIRENPEAAAEIRRRRRAVKANAPTIPFTADQLAQRFAYWGNRCWICGADEQHVDHMKPLARGGWHCLANLRPICKSCNASKGAEWPYDPTPRRALLAGHTSPDA